MSFESIIGIIASLITIFLAVMGAIIGSSDISSDTAVM